ncbi:3-oxoacyl-ACP synthase [Paenibacillus dendritiformis]|uniref:ketoacyl-ACP synthase III n=1 Tax=Paenibacillus dendritiformis TaxID=130049 RepID=UPI0018CF7180|nr:ketoacyl-ACP synthase III [Paenibacillus dendritiformis]MBG9796113.1 3-oxoacyl-ACP synthase [Paenibacillus dendritiformis]
MPITRLHTKARITAFGSYVPERRLTNDDLAAMVDTNDEWIVTRTGMKERRIAAPDAYASDLAVMAANDLAERHGIDLRQVDAILVATSTPDAFFPNTAALVQARLGMDDALALDISNACAGFVSGLQLGIGLIEAGLHQRVLVLGTEVLSKTVDYTDRSTCILFGDGAGAMLLEADDRRDSFVASLSDTTGDTEAVLYRRATADRIGEAELREDGKLVQNGRVLYKWALQQIPAGIGKILSLLQWNADAVDWFIPHSANLRMIEAISERSGIPMERTLTSVAYYGNTSAASIPLSISLALKEGKLKPGDMTLLYGFGGGFSQAALLLRWPRLQ